MTLPETLADLLAELFDSHELREEVVARLPDGESIARGLPGPGTAPTALAAATEAALRRRGHVDDDFFDLLLKLRPRRATDIHRVKAALVGAGSVSQRSGVLRQSAHPDSVRENNVKAADLQGGTMIFNGPVNIQGGHVGPGPHVSMDLGSTAGAADRKTGLRNPQAQAPEPVAQPTKPLSSLERLAEEQRRREVQAQEAAKAKARRDEMVLDGAKQATAEVLVEIKAVAEKAVALLPEGQRRFRIEPQTGEIAVYYDPAVLVARYYQFYTNVPDGKLRVLYSTRKGDWFRDEWKRVSNDDYPLEFTTESGLHWSVQGRQMSSKDLAEKLVLRLIELGDVETRFR